MDKEYIDAQVRKEKHSASPSAYRPALLLDPTGPMHPLVVSYDAGERIAPVTLYPDSHAANIASELEERFPDVCIPTRADLCEPNLYAYAITAFFSSPEYPAKAECIVAGSDTTYGTTMVDFLSYRAELRFVDPPTDSVAENKVQLYMQPIPPVHPPRPNPCVPPIHTMLDLWFYINTASPQHKNVCDYVTHDIRASSKQKIRVQIAAGVEVTEFRIRFGDASP
jgi:hypothetical protein